MRKRAKSSRKGPSPTPPEKRARLQEIAQKYGVKPHRAGESLDKKYNTKAAEDNESGGGGIYLALVNLLGTSTLDTLEVGLIAVLAGLLGAFLLLGIGISSEAFFKATGGTMPPSFAAALDHAEPLFTPVLFVFLALSSLFGLYKQSQLKSGATGYVERRGTRKD